MPPAPARATLRPPPRRRTGAPRTGSWVALWRFRSYLRPYAVRFVVLAVLAALGIAATIVVPLVTRAVVDGPIAESDRRGLYTLGAAAIALGVVEAVLMFARRWVVSKATLGVETDVRVDLYAALQRLPMPFHSRWSSGQLLSRMMSDLSTIRRFLGFELLFIVVNRAQIAVVVAILLHLYWPLGLVVLASTVPVVGVSLRTEKAYTRLSRAVQDQTGDVASAVEEVAHGVRAIKSFGRSAHVRGTFDVAAVRLHDTALARVRVQSGFWTFLGAIPSVTLIIVLGVGALAAGQGRVTLGTLVAYRRSLRRPAPGVARVAELSGGPLSEEKTPPVASSRPGSAARGVKSRHWWSFVRAGMSVAATRVSAVVQPDRQAARAERVAAGLDELDQWLRDQVRTGIAQLGQGGYGPLDRMAARMVDAQAPGVAGLLRALPGETARDGWPARLLEQLGALQLIIEAHRRLDALPPDLAATVRTRVGYPVRKADVLAGPGVPDHWYAVGEVDSLDYRLLTRRVWLWGATTRRWALLLSFTPPGGFLDDSVRVGQRLHANLHFYPGSGQYRVLVGDRESPIAPPILPEPESYADLAGRFADLLAADPWATRMPAVVLAAAVPPEQPSGRWRLREAGGACRDLVELPGEPWPLFARSLGTPVPVFGEWGPAGFRPLSLLPDSSGGFSAVTVAQAA